MGGSRSNDYATEAPIVAICLRNEQQLVIFGGELVRFKQCTVSEKAEELLKHNYVRKKYPILNTKYSNFN